MKLSQFEKNRLVLSFLRFNEGIKLRSKIKEFKGKQYDIKINGMNNTQHS